VVPRGRAQRAAAPSDIGPSPVVAPPRFDIAHLPTYHSPLMSQGLPATIEPLRLAELGRAIEGKMPLSRLRRLSDLLVDTAGDVEVSLEFIEEAPRRPVVRGSLRAALRLACQRCLEPLDVPVAIPVRLVIVRSEAEAERLDEGEDPLVAGEHPVSLAELIEDELLLALPQVPVHPWAVCGSAVEATRAGEEHAVTPPNPFAVLEALRQGKGRREDS